MHQKEMRADGLLLADMHALKLADRTLSTGTSNLLPLTMLTKAEPYIDDPDSFDTMDDPMELFGKRNHTVVSKEQLYLLIEHVQHMVASLGNAIYQGHIAIQPCRLKQFTGCQYCKYQSICRIQTVDILKNSQVLSPLSQELLWERLELEMNREGVMSYAGMDNGTTAGH